MCICFKFFYYSTSVNKKTERCRFINTKSIQKSSIEGKNTSENKNGMFVVRNENTVK